MPFTPSHAVVALPFVRSPLPAAAIAVGAMTPDLPLFLRGTPLTYGLTHSFATLVVTAAVAIVLLGVWYAGLRPAVRELSPRVLAERLPESWDTSGTRTLVTVAGSWAQASLIVVAAAIGVVSHIVWDLFTHEGRWGTVLVPVLAEQWGPFDGYRWLQYASSALGLIVLGLWGSGWLARQRPVRVERALPDAVRWSWWLSLPLVLSVSWVGGLAVHGPLDEEFGVRHLAYLVLPAACGLWGVGTLVLCVAVQAVQASGRRR